MRIGAAPAFETGTPTSGVNPAITPGAASSPSPSLRCPRCRRTLVPSREGELQCTRPSRPHSYPIVCGIPDLRTTLEADITVARERADAKLLAEMLSRVPQDGDGLDKELSLLVHDGIFAEQGWGIGLAAESCSSEDMLIDWQALDRDAPDARMVLVMACGAGVLLEAAARRWPICVGVDSSLRRLVIVRHRLKQAGVRARLVCANADALPFVDGLFDRVLAESVLELLPRKERPLREWNRALSAQGRLWISTTNRWSVNRDARLGIPTLSWLPIQLVDLWAKRHGLTFPRRTLVGTKRLRGLLEETGFSGVRLGEPNTGESHGAASTHRSAKTPGRRSLYDLPLIRKFARRAAPMLLAAAGASTRQRGRVAFDRYMARQAL